MQSPQKVPFFPWPLKEIQGKHKSLCETFSNVKPCQQGPCKRKLVTRTLPTLACVKVRDHANRRLPFWSFFIKPPPSLRMQTPGAPAVRGRAAGERVELRPGGPSKRRRLVAQLETRDAMSTAGLEPRSSNRNRRKIWLWVKTNGCHFGVGAPPILGPILVGIGMFTGGTGDPWSYEACAPGPFELVFRCGEGSETA